MNNKRKIGFIGVTILVMILLVWAFSGGEDAGNNKSKRQPFVSSNWSSRFQPFDKKPMGLYLFNSLANAHLDTSHNFLIVQNWIQLDSILINDSLPKTFMFVGNGFGLQNSELDAILSEVKGGSRIFLSYYGLTENIYPRFFNDYNEFFDYSESINVFANKQQYKMINLFQNDTIACNWRAFGELESNYKYKSLSSFMELDNFIKMEYGNGYTYFHTTPNMFYNYQIKRQDGFKYASYVLNQIPKDQDILLLELGRLTDNYGNEDVDEQTGAEGKIDDSYLKVIFESPMLLTALLLSLLGIILFVVFRSKRMRPVVPFIEKKKDMTLAFAETITSIYFAKRNPYGLLQVQRKNFNSVIRKHFFVDLTRREGDRELEILAEKSNKSISEIKELVAAFETKKASEVTEQSVAELTHKKLAFYSDTGIVSTKTLDRIEDNEKTYRKALFIPSILILGGLFLIVFGFYYLMSSMGIGIVFWPIGLMTIYLGIVRITKPFMIINKEEIIHYNLLGRKKNYKREQLISIEKKETGAILHFTENRQLVINRWDLSRFDQKQFEQFIIKFQTEQI